MAGFDNRETNPNRQKHLISMAFRVTGVKGPCLGPCCLLEDESHATLAWARHDWQWCYTSLAMPTETNLDRPSSTPHTVLVVDDDSTIRAVVSTTLEHHGFTVLKAKHADEALEICRFYKAPIHLLFADLMLPPKVRLARSKCGQPAMHGFELMRQVSAMRPGIRVILFSGQPDVTIKAMGVVPPSVPFLRKPFSLDALVRTVCHTLNPPQPPS
jgi:CheY-like chemotaxis protein